MGSYCLTTGVLYPHKVYKESVRSQLCTALLRYKNSIKVVDRNSVTYLHIMQNFREGYFTEYLAVTYSTR
jgi:hypothetical protein